MASSALCVSTQSRQQCVAALGRSTASLLSLRHHAGNAANTRPRILHVPSLGSLRAYK